MNLRVAVWIVLVVAAGDAAAAVRAFEPFAHVAGLFERGRGAAFEARDANQSDDRALSLALGFDARRSGAAGDLDASVFALAQDPASGADRSLFGAARLRATRVLSAAWRLALDETARAQRGRRLALSDWQHNQASVSLERRSASGRRLALVLADRRRGVPGEPALGFARQTLDVVLGLPLGARHELQLQLGPQRFTARAGDGTRLGGAAELLRVGARGVLAVRAAWTEPLAESAATGAASSAPGLPPPDRSPGAFVAYNPTLSPRTAPLPQPAAPDEPRAGLLSESLIVDPAEDALDDWDLGRRKQELLALGSWRLGARASLAVAARLARERGPDRLAPVGAPRVAQERASLRVSLRKPVASHVTLVVQAAWQGRRDARPGYAYSRLAVSAGVELRP